MRWIYTIITVILCYTANCQNTIPLVFKNESSRTTSVGVFTYRGTLYLSLTDLITIFSLGSYHNVEAQKLEIKTGNLTFKVTANNPFVIITERDGNTNVSQLQSNILFAANAYFAPLESFIPIINHWGIGTFSFDRAKSVLYVERRVDVSLYDVTNLSFEEKTNGLLIRIHLNKKLKDYESWLKQTDGDSWLFVTLADVRADVTKLKKVKKIGMLKDILIFQSPTSVQLTFKLRGQITRTELIPASDSNDLILTIYTPTEERIITKERDELNEQLERQRQRWKLDVIVIDPGHGGDDPGTIGVSGTKEKDITLQISLRLGKIIEKQMPDVKVVYTRKTDQFVELHRRGKIANEHGGKLFISIHCNSVPRKPHPVNGFEIYLLRPGKTEHALRIAERENSVIRLEKDFEQHYQQLTEENFILLTMAQSAYMKYSELFADFLQQEMEHRLQIRNNGVKQAGFYVLVGASMPNVLIEVGYLSNKNDERYLRSTAGQQQIAEAIFNAIKRYKLEYENSVGITTQE